MSKQSRAELEAQVSEAVRDMQRATDALDQAAADFLGINRTDGRCLDYLYGAEPMTAGQLAERAGLSPAAVTTVLDRLEARGLVRRVRDRGDRRRVLIALTEELHRLTLQTYGPLMEASKGLAKYGEYDLEVVRDFLNSARDIQNEQARRVRELPPYGGPDATLQAGAGRAAPERTRSA